MKQNNWKMAARALALMATMVIGGQAQAEEPPVKIGLMTLFGGGQVGGKTVVAAAQMAIDDFGGEVLGRKIELLTADDQFKPDNASLIARRWLDQDKVSVIIPNTSTPSTLAVMDLAVPMNVPVLLAGPGSEILTNEKCSPLTANYIWNSYSLPRAVVNGLLGQGVNSWYMISVDNAFGKSMEANLEEFVTKGGGKVLGVSRHPIGMTDFSSLILQAQASGAQAIAYGTTGDDLVNLIKQSREFGIIEGGQKIAGLAVNIQAIHALGLQSAQGLQMVTPFYHDMNDETRAWTKRYMERPDTQVPTLIEAGMYSAVYHYLQAVKAAGTTAGDVVMKKVREIPVNDFEMKDVMIRADGTPMRPMYLVRVKAPSESKEAFDYFTIEETIPPEQAWRPAADSTCPLQKQQ